MHRPILRKRKSLPKPTSAAGEYWQYAGRGISEVLALKPQEKAGTYLADWTGYYFGIMGLYYGPNPGDFGEKVTIAAGKSTILLREEGLYECRIALSLAPDQQSLTLSTDDPSNCGFGHNVSADGKYLRVN